MAKTPTPGPWKVSRNQRWVVDANGYQVLYPSSARSRDEAEANVILAAAAPELKRVLGDLVARCDGPSGVRPDGSNIDTLEAHYLLAEIDPETWDEKEIV